MIKGSVVNVGFDYGTKKPDGQHERHPVDTSGEPVNPYRDTYTHNRCGGVATKIGSSIAETYQKNPKFYNRTFCVGCRDYFHVAEFQWDDGVTVGQ